MSPSIETHLLIIDDTPSNLQLLMSILGDKGYQIHVAQNGSQALKKVEAVIPDLILLDVMMPDMNGYEVCKLLKQKEQTADIPVIFISALEELNNKAKAFAAGGVDYIVKPFEEEEVLMRVETQLELKRYREELEKLVDQRTEELNRKNIALTEILNHLQEEKQKHRIKYLTM